MDLIDRIYYLKFAKQLADSIPILGLLGPRQCGKTTFAKQVFGDFDYLDLELPSDYAKLAGDPELFLKSRKRSLVIDEAQRYPPLFPILRAIVDGRRKEPGQYVLLGSASWQLRKDISESLTGRIAFMDMTPFQLCELPSSISWSTHWLKGGFPDALLLGPTEAFSFMWAENYTRTLIERDLPALGIDFGAIEFRRLWAMCAHFHGQVLNKNKIASSLGVSPHTVDRYLNILEQTFSIRRLAPYHGNLKKRLVKSPKLYFRDSGLFHYFTRTLCEEDLIASPWRGASFEGYVIENLLSRSALETPEWEAFFFRTSDEIETDLVLTRGIRKVAIEIKAKLSPTLADVKGLLKTVELLKLKKAYVIGLGEDRFPIAKNIECIGIDHWRAGGCLPFWIE